MAKPTLDIMWFRRDLRLGDNAALYHALRGEHNVVPVFCFDTNILDDLEDKHDRRVQFIHNAISDIQTELKKLGSTLEVFYAKPKEMFEALVKKYTIATVYTNNDYEQYAIDRDSEVASFLKQKGAAFKAYKDQVIFEKDEVMKPDGSSYAVFTPYSRKWKEKLNAFYLKSYPTKNYFKNFYKQQPKRIPSLKAMGFKEANFHFEKPDIPEEIIRHYDKTRDYPAIHGTSRLSIHLRFGTISIRKLAAKAKQLNSLYLGELIWRDFYHMILWNNEGIRKGENYKQQYNAIKWRNSEKEFEAWCNGKTGYPIVDAGMRQLNETGFMHNRVRMITASFLSKHLLIDWHWGDAYFAKKLNDYDYAANNGGFQWCAGTGVDAQPYFRIFNPYKQTKKFDKDLAYIRHWVPELETFEYPEPIVAHEFARKRCLEVYGNAVKKQ